MFAVGLLLVKVILLINMNEILLVIAMGGSKD